MTNCAPSPNLSPIPQHPGHPQCLNALKSCEKRGEKPASSSLEGHKNRGGLGKSWKTPNYHASYPLVIQHCGKSPCLMGKSTISMISFNSFVSHYQMLNGGLNMPQEGKILEPAMGRSPAMEPVTREHREQVV